MPNQQFMFQGVILVAFILIMYFMLIRPQKKKEQEVEDMRNSIRTGDVIVTIGGIVGKVVKVKEDSFIIQVGADKTKFEIKRWAVSSVDKDPKRASSPATREEEDPRKPKPKRLGKKEQEPVEETVLIASEEKAEEVVSEAVEQVEAATDEAIETAVEVAEEAAGE